MTEFERIKAEFKKAMPHVIVDPYDDLDEYEHKKIVRLFVMGWLACLVGHKDQLQQDAEGLYLDAKFLAVQQENWFPDKSWRW